MPNANPYLPGVLGQIAEEIGQEVALKLAEARGGRSIYVPQHPTAKTELAKVVGVEAAAQIKELLGRGDLAVPCGSLRGTNGRRARIQALLAEGKSQGEIAEIVDVSLRTVERVAARVTDDRQGDLFGGLGATDK